jgi:site-specific recombinase XerC
VRQWFYRADADTGLHVWPHLERHIFGTKLAPVTDLRTWIELMNHKDGSQFRRYAHPKERGREALDLALPIR